MLPFLRQIAQIGLSAYQIICLSVFLAKDLSSGPANVLFFVTSLLVSKATPLFAPREDEAANCDVPAAALMPPGQLGLCFSNVGRSRSVFWVSWWPHWTPVTSEEPQSAVNVLHVGLMINRPINLSHVLQFADALPEFLTRLFTET